MDGSQLSGSQGVEAVGGATVCVESTRMCEEQRRVQLFVCATRSQMLVAIEGRFCWHWDLQGLIDD